MTINCKGKLIDFSSPKVMGVLNITPDSFYRFYGAKFFLIFFVHKINRSLISKDRNMRYNDYKDRLFIAYLRYSLYFMPLLLFGDYNVNKTI